MLGDKTTLQKLHKLLSEHRCRHQVSDTYANTMLCAQLKCIQFPSNPNQRLDYLTKERELLIQIISDYQLECLRLKSSLDSLKETQRRAESANEALLTQNSEKISLPKVSQSNNFYEPTQGFQHKLSNSQSQTLMRKDQEISKSTKTLKSSEFLQKRIKETKRNPANMPKIIHSITPIIKTDEIVSHSPSTKSPPRDKSPSSKNSSKKPSPRLKKDPVLPIEKVLKNRYTPQNLYEEQPRENIPIPTPRETVKEALKIEEGDTVKFNESMKNEIKEALKESAKNEENNEKIDDFKVESEIQNIGKNEEKIDSKVENLLKNNENLEEVPKMVENLPENDEKLEKMPKNDTLENDENLEKIPKSTEKLPDTDENIEKMPENDENLEKLVQNTEKVNVKNIQNYDENQEIIENSENIKKQAQNIVVISEKIEKQENFDSVKNISENFVENQSKMPENHENFDQEKLAEQKKLKDAQDKIQELINNFEFSDSHNFEDSKNNDFNDLDNQNEAENNDKNEEIKQELQKMDDFDKKVEENTEKMPENNDFDDMDILLEEVQKKMESNRAGENKEISNKNEQIEILKKEQKLHVPTNSAISVEEHKNQESHDEKTEFESPHFLPNLEHPDEKIVDLAKSNNENIAHQQDSLEENLDSDLNEKQNEHQTENKDENEKIDENSQKVLENAKNLTHPEDYNTPHFTQENEKNIETHKQENLKNEEITANKASEIIEKAEVLEDFKNQPLEIKKEAPETNELQNYLIKNNDMNENVKEIKNEEILQKVETRKSKRNSGKVQTIEFEDNDSDNPNEILEKLPEQKMNSKNSSKVESPELSPEEQIKGILKREIMQPKIQPASTISTNPQIFNKLAPNIVISQPNSKSYFPDEDSKLKNPKSLSIAVESTKNIQKLSPSSHHSQESMDRVLAEEMIKRMLLESLSTKSKEEIKLFLDPMRVINTPPKRVLEERRKAQQESLNNSRMKTEPKPEVIDHAIRGYLKNIIEGMTPDQAGKLTKDLTENINKGIIKVGTPSFGSSQKKGNVFKF